MAIVDFRDLVVVDDDEMGFSGELWHLKLARLGPKRSRLWLGSVEQLICTYMEVQKRQKESKRYIICLQDRTATSWIASGHSTINTGFI